MLKSLLRKAKAARAAPRVPDDVRVYAIGDVHGCDAQFAELLDRIAEDDAARPPKRRVTILLGDLVDRGPDSAGAVERARALVTAGNAHAIAGNHEELLLGAIAGHRPSLRLLVRNGGRETSLSYGVLPDDYDRADLDELAGLLDAAIPADHRAFMAAMEELVVIGDYAFVHAGIRPGVALAEQRAADLRWIRAPFLDHSRPHEKVVVHGHTIVPDVVIRDNRIGIDTGAYLSGRLSALALEGDRRWTIQT